jgi:OFA family oxalate/formate antiporter-like MFS transporter
LLSRAGVRDPVGAERGAAALASIQGGTLGLAVLEQLQARRRSAYRGWTIVFVASVCMACVFSSSTSTLPLIYGPVIEEFGWSRTEATFLFTSKRLVSAVAALFLIGPLYERFGLKRVTIAAFVVSGAAMAAFLWVDSLWSYYAAGIVLGVGVTTAFVAANVLVSRWFVRNQGLAVGVMLAGASVGGLVAPSLYAWLEPALGWRGAFAMLSLGIWLVALPLFVAKAKDEPSVEETLAEQSPADARAATATTSNEPLLRAELRRPTFWVIALSLLLVAGTDAGLMQHSALLLEYDAGLSTSAVAAALSAAIGLGVAAKICAGWVFDRYSLNGVALWCVLLALSVVLALTLADSITLLLFIGLRGIAHGGLMLAPAAVARHCYPPRMMHLTLSTFMGVWALGTALGPLVAAALYDWHGSYSIAFMILIGCSIVAALALAGVRTFLEPPMAAGGHARR